MNRIICQVKAYGCEGFGREEQASVTGSRVRTILPGDLARYLFPASCCLLDSFFFLPPRQIVQGIQREELPDGGVDKAAALAAFAAEADRSGGIQELGKNLAAGTAGSDRAP